MTSRDSKIASLSGALALSLLLSGAGFQLECQSDPEGPASNLVTTGHMTVDGHSVPYRIRRLPVNSFPDLPAKIAESLSQRGCLVPQTYEAHHPENVVHASLEHAGSSDWAVLCALQGKVSLLVFFGAHAGEPVLLATVPETERVQPRNGTGLLGFDWGIDAATPQAVHEAQSGLEPRPPLLDHDALADTVIDHPTSYRFYSKGGWTTLDMPE